MADTYGPFDLHPWSEDDWYNFAPHWAPDGVLETGELDLTVSGLTLTLSAGRAWVGGSGYARVAPLESVSVTANTHTQYSRRDRLVLRRSRAGSSVTPFVVQGTPASSPAAPNLSRSPGGDWDLPLWSFLVPPNSGTAITGLVDERFVSKPHPMAIGTTLPATAPDGAIFYLVS